MTTATEIVRLHRRVDEVQRQATGWEQQTADGSDTLDVRKARIVSGGGGGSSVSANCEVEIWNIEFVDASFYLSAGLQTATATRRRTDLFKAAAPANLILSVNDLVSVMRSNDHLWILKRYGVCPQP